MKSGFKAWFADFLSGSLILRCIRALGKVLYDRLGTGVYGYLFGSYDAVCNDFDKSALGRLRKNLRAERVRRQIADNIENSIYVKSISAFAAFLWQLSMRVIGIFLISCGLYAGIAQFIRYLLADGGAFNLDIAVSAGLILLGIPLLLSPKPLCSAVGDSSILRAFFVGFLGCFDRDFDADGEPRGRKTAAFVLGLPFGILSFFFGPVYPLVFLLLLSALYAVLRSPEFGLYATVFALPFLIVLPHPSILLAVMVLYTYFSYSVKRILGKRYFKFELLDVLVFCFMVMMLFGGVVSYGGRQSLAAAGIYTVLMLGYFLTVGLIRTKEKLSHLLLALGSSAFLVSLYGIYQYLSGNISTEWMDTEMFEGIGGRAVSTFENPNMLGQYLILLLPLFAAAVMQKQNRVYGAGYLLLCLAGAGCLIYTWARGAWLGFMLSAVIFLLIWSRHAMSFLAAGALLSPFALPFLPSSIVDRFTSIGNLADTSTNYRAYIWRGSVKVARDYGLFGIGIGENAFSKIYPYYAFNGIEKAPHAHNLFLQLLISLGLFGFLLFIVLLFVFLQSGFTLAKRGQDHSTRMIGCGALCGVIAALVQGLTDYTWYNYRVYFIFWVVFGVASAAARISAAAVAQEKTVTDAFSAERSF